MSCRSPDTTAILDGSLRDVEFTEHPILGLRMPAKAPKVPAEVLNPRDTWRDKDAYDAKAQQLATLFRENDAKYQIADEVRAAGPSV